MEYLEQKQGDIVIINITGKIDTATSNEVEKKIVQLFETNLKKLAIDCTGLSYISSSGLRIFLMALKQLNKMQGKIVIFGMNDLIKEVFEVSGFTSIFKIFETKEEALKNL